MYWRRHIFFLFQLLQNLGKADKTTDEIFEEHLLNFNQQQANSTRLQKDIANYIRCIKGITYLYRSPYIIITWQGRRSWKGGGGINGTHPPLPQFSDFPPFLEGRRNWEALRQMCVPNIKIYKVDSFLLCNEWKIYFWWRTSLFSNFSCMFLNPNIFF